MMLNMEVLPKQTQRGSKYRQNMLNGDSTYKSRIKCGGKPFETFARLKKTEKFCWLFLANKLISKH
jgi:hypothetical protein